MHISLQPNPSHLEAVDPVVVGKVRARQDMAGDTKTRRSVMGILMHGDAAFAGQGLVYETLAMSQLIGYRTGGTIHLIVNNQIGFTTVPAHAYSGLYCTDVAKSIQAPILHVNGDNPEAVMFCARLAAEFRQEFATDFVLDIVCYRRHGHNETDEPAFTQPIMYRAITRPADHAHAVCRAAGRRGHVPRPRRQAHVGRVRRHAGGRLQGGAVLQAEQGGLAGRALDRPQAADSEDEGRGRHRGRCRAAEAIGLALATVPDGFDLNPKIARQLEAKRAMVENGEGIDWATGEALAFGGLLLEGHRVRLSGEDCQRGTFSQRHAVLIDQTNQNEYVPLNNIRDGQAKIEIYNSLLSEAGVLGFEYGYTLADPQTLVLWEAQFGDFANGAQVIIDQFLASGETKWLRMSGLTLLLPHGYEGQGPEHSSARLERYLQLCAERNMTVGNLTTPANYFHALRRQLKRNFRKPLVIMTPKIAAAAQAGRVAAGRVRRAAAVPHGDRRDRPDRAGRAGQARRDVHRQGLLRPAGGAPGAGRARRGASCGWSRSIRSRAARCRGAGAVPERRGRLVPGGAREHGRLELRRPPDRACAARLDARPAGPTMSGGTRRPARRPGWPRCMRRSSRPGARALGAELTTLRKEPYGDRHQGAHAGRERHHGDRGALAEEGRRGRAADEPLVELETDKVTVEVNAPSAGTLGDVSAEEGRRGRGRRPARHARARAAPRRARPSRHPGVARARQARRGRAGPAAATRRRAPAGPVARPATPPADVAAAHAPMPSAAKMMEENGSRPSRSAPAPARTAASPRVTCSPS